MSVLITCSDGKKRRFTLRGNMSHLRTESAVRHAIANTLNGYRKQGGAWIAYADALERKSIVEQMCLIGMVSN